MRESSDVALERECPVAALRCPVKGLDSEEVVVLVAEMARDFGVDVVD